MAKNPKEVGPVNISLGKIVKLYKKKEQNLLDVGAADKELLGAEAWEEFYKTANTNQRDASYYKRTQGYTGAERIFKYYFDEKGDKYSKRIELKRIIHDNWLSRIKESIPEFKDKLKVFRDDGVLCTSGEESVGEIRQFLTRFAEAETPEDRADVMTVLTLLSITRGFWGKLKAEDILPDNPERDPEQIIQEDIFREAKDLLAKQKYHEAIEQLQQVIQYRTEDGTDESAERLNRVNGRAHYLISKASRELRKMESPGSDQFHRYTDDIRSSLEEARLCHHIPSILEMARDYFMLREDAVYEKEEAECRALCEEIIRVNAQFEAGGERFGKECGEAFWMLYCLETDDNKADSYLQKSASYSYDKAVAEWTEKHEVSLIQSLKESKDPSCGSFYMNEDNIYSDIIQKTAAAGWTQGVYPLNQKNIGLRNHAVSINTRGLQKYFLISDDFDKNLQELLQLLQFVKEKASNCVDKQIEFYIRGIEDEIAPFIDTALARISICVPVHILDDSKMAARVLAKHPLFYPIRGLKKGEASSLNLVVIGDTPCCEWIIREALWMLTFRNKQIHAAIILVSPNPDRVEARLKLYCPDLEKAKSSGSPLEIKKQTCNLDTVDILNAIKPYVSDEKTYMAVDTGSDTFNASLAVKIRETSIREYIDSSRDELKKDFPIIAFRCENPDISNLARRSIVVNEAYGYKWFNNYALIPFGGVDQSYTWNELTNNLFEVIGLNVHLQYYKNPDLLNPGADEYDRDYKEAEKSFWSRTYNRDSSIAVAMSIPYRLYQSSLTTTGSPLMPIGMDPLDSKPLNILDDSVFFSEEAFDAYSVQFKKAGKRAARDTYETRKKIAAEADESKASRNSFDLCMKHAGELLPDMFDENLAGWQNVNYQKPMRTSVSDNYESKKLGIFSKGMNLYQYKMEDDIDSELYQLAEWEHDRWIRFMISRGWTLAKIKNMKLYYSEGNTRQQLYIGKMHPCMIPYEDIEKVDKAWSSLTDKPYSFKENDIFAIQMTEQILNREWTRTRDNYLNNLESKEVDLSER